MMKFMIGRICVLAAIVAGGLIAGTTNGAVAQSVDKAGQLPKAVAAQVSDLIYACRKSGQMLAAPAAYIKIADIDGDGKPDYVIDVSKGCEVNRLALCGSEGCVINVYLSSKTGSAVALRGSQPAIEVANGQTAVKVVRAGTGCSGAACEDRFSYADGKLQSDKR